jgi:hypothetical protein
LLASLTVGPSAAQTCASSGTDAYTCTGDFSSGLTIQNEVPSSTTTVDVTSLTTEPPFVQWTFSDTTLDTATLIVTGASTTIGSTTAGIPVVNFFSAGANGSNGADEDDENGHAGDDGTVGVENLNLTFKGTYVSGGTNRAVIEAESIGGNGGTGGKSNDPAAGDGGNGGAGGAGSFITVIGSGSLTVTGDNNVGLLVQSQGGNGGKAGEAVAGESGIGGAGGAGQEVTVSPKPAEQ